MNRNKKSPFAYRRGVNKIGSAIVGWLLIISVVYYLISAVIRLLS